MLPQRSADGSAMTERNDWLAVGGLSGALAEIARHPASRDELISALRRIEGNFHAPEINVREYITGPIVDALFTQGELLTKTLTSGLAVSFRYTSKIARDFVMAGDRPDHVWEPQTTKLLLMLASTMRNAVFAGAYFGDQALLAAAAMRQVGGRCYCFEIDAIQIDLLESNARANALDNIVAFQQPLWSRAGLRLALVGKDALGSLREAREESCGLPTTASLDDFARSASVDHIQLLSIDVEGGELEVLRGAQSYLRQPETQAPTVIFEIHRSYVDWSSGLENTEIARFLETSGYVLFAIRDYQGNVDMRGRPIEIVPIRTAYLDGPPHGFNVLAVKQKDIITNLGLRVVENVSPKLLFHRDPRLHQPLN
jgi:FkbM family methyltransferase